MKNKWVQNKVISRIFWIIVVGSLWQMIVKQGIFDPMIFPGIDVIFKTLYESITKGQIIEEIVYSFVLIGKGLFIGLISAIIISSLCMTWKALHEFIETLIAIAHPLPGIALLPLIILWLGTGTNAIVFIIVHSVVWPMVLNVLAGFRSIPSIYREVGQNLGLSSVDNIRLIMVPAAFPYLLTGVKISWARAWRALISAEMVFGAVGGKGGLGWYIFQKRVFMDTAGIYAGLIVIIAIGVLIEDFVFYKIEKVTVKKWGMTI